MHQFFQIFIVAFPTWMILSTLNYKDILIELGAKHGDILTCGRLAFFE